MITDVRIIHAKDFVIATPEGSLNRERTRKLLLEMVIAGFPTNELNIVLDTRYAESILSAEDLWYLAAEINKPGLFRRKIAILCPVHRFDKADFFALSVRQRGLRAKAFTSYEDVMNWLVLEDITPESDPKD